MSSQFSSIDEAKEVAAAIFGVKPTDFKPEEDSHVAGIDSGLLDDPDADEELKQLIRDRKAQQKGFKCKKGKKEIHIVIGPFRFGFDLWLINKNGTAVRL